MSRTYKNNVKVGIAGGNKYIKNTWEEPNDGSYLYNKEIIKKNARENGGIITKFQRKISRYIKSMRPWNRNKNRKEKLNDEKIN